MQYRTLGSTDLQVSTVGLGTWQLGGAWGKDFAQAEVNEMFEVARDVGINLIDTAECYGDHLSERLIGTALAELFPGERESWIIATKFGHKFRNAPRNDSAWEPDQVRASVEDSLRALKTDYVDLLQFHSGSDEVFQTPGLWAELAALKDEGKVRHLGISIGSNRNVFQTGSAAEVGAEAIQVVYNRLDRGPEEAVFDVCKRDNLGVLARVPLASGFLSGKYKPGATFIETDVRSRRAAEQVEAALAEVQKIKGAEVPQGMPMAQWALAWCLKNPVVTSVIPGCKSPEQVRENALAADTSI